MIPSTTMEGVGDDAGRDAAVDAAQPRTHELPPVGSPGAEHRPASALRLSHITAAIGHTILAVIAVGVLLVFRTELVSWIVLAGALPLLVILLVLDLTIFNRWEQRWYTYTVTADFVYITSGRFLRSTMTMPTPHILAVETQQGPIQRRLDLMTVQFTTITGQQELGPIAPSDAQRIRDRVTRALQEHEDA